MKITIILLFTVLLSACGGLPGVSAPSTPQAAPASASAIELPGSAVGPTSEDWFDLQSDYYVSIEKPSYSVSTDAVVVNITNASYTDGGFDGRYRLESKVGTEWQALPLEIPAADEWIPLPADGVLAHSYSLLQNQYEYSPGIYRIVLLGVQGEPSVEFALEE